MTNLIEKEILIDVIKNPNDTFYENVLSDFLDEQDVDHDFRKPLHNNSVTELKPYQEKCLDIWANHWTNIGLCTRPTDEKKAEKYFCYFYNQSGFSTSKNVVWLDNPIEMCSQVSNCINNQTFNRVWNQTWNKTFNQVWSQVWYQVWCQVWRRVGNQVVQVQWRVWDYISNQTFNQARNQLLNQVFYGQQDAYRLALYAYVMQVLRVEAPKQFVPFMLLAQEVNWWFPAEETVYVIRKPKECVVEDNKLVKITFQDNYTIT
jgi:hypothetical protein